MKRARLVLSIVLVASLALNAYLWATTPQEPKRGFLAPQEKPTGVVRPPVVMPELNLPPANPSVPSTYAAENRAALEQRLVRAEARLDELMMPNERYPLLARSPETEERVRPYLDRVFMQSGSDKPKYSVECHGPVCKLTASYEDKWIEDLQTLPGREMFKGMWFGPEGTFIELSSQPPNGRRVIQEILMTADADFEACGAMKATGTLSLAFALDASTHTIRVSTAGLLAREPIGECMRKAVENAIARGYVSPDLTSLPAEPVELTLPLQRPTTSTH